MALTPALTPFRKVLLAAVALLVCAGAAALVVPSWLGSPSQGCPRPEPKMTGLSPKTFEGRYRGPDGMTLHLSADGPRMEVRNWPFDLTAVDDGEVGESGTGEVRRFAGSGSWEYGVTADSDADGKRTGKQYPRLSLDFTTGHPADEVPPFPQTLLVGGTRDHPVLFEQDDPGTCTDAVFRRG